MNIELLPEKREATVDLPTPDDDIDEVIDYADDDDYDDDNVDDDVDDDDGGNSELEETSSANNGDNAELCVEINTFLQTSQSFSCFIHQLT